MQQELYATGKHIPTTSNPNEVYYLYKKGLDESLSNRNEYQFLFCWNYNRLGEEGKNTVCQMIMNKI